MELIKINLNEKLGIVQIRDYMLQNLKKELGKDVFFAVSFFIRVIYFVGPFISPVMVPYSITFVPVFVPFFIPFFMCNLCFVAVVYCPINFVFICVNIG